MSAQWLMSLYSLCACFGGGTLVALGLAEALSAASRTRKVAAASACVLLLAGIASFVLALGRPSAVMSVATNAANGSPKSIEFVCALLCLVAAAAYLVVTLRSESETPGRVVGVAGLVLGVAMGVAAGCSSAVGRPTVAVALPCAWLGNALAFGGSLFAAIMALRGEDVAEFRRFCRFALVGVVVQAVGFALYGICAGSLANAFVYGVGALAVGTVVPAVCLLVASRARAFAFAALVGTVVGGVCLRVVVLAAGTASLNLIASAAQRVAL